MKRIRNRQTQTNERAGESRLKALSLALSVLRTELQLSRCSANNSGGHGGGGVQWPCHPGVPAGDGVDEAGGCTELGHLEAVVGVSLGQGIWVLFLACGV